MLPRYHLYDQRMPLVFCKADEDFLRENYDEISVTGEIHLPSGRILHAPPLGRVWYISNGTVEDRPPKKDELVVDQVECEEGDRKAVSHTRNHLPKWWQLWKHNDY